MTRRDKALPQGEHLNGHGEPCDCQCERKPAAAVPQGVSKPNRKLVLTRAWAWDSQERAVARRAGHQVWVKSESERQG